MHKLIVCTSLFFIPGIALYAQDYTGIWQGKLTQGPGGCFPEYFIELQITSRQGTYSGVSYDYYDTARFVKLNFEGTLGATRRSLLIREQKVLAQQIPEDCAPCLKTYDLEYSVDHNVEHLSGKWVGEDMGTTVGCPPGNIHLTRVKTSAFENRQRTSEIAAEYVFSQASINIAFYDNGVIDGDTITVLLDGRVLALRQGLSLKPLKIELELLPFKTYQLRVVSESMGSIPPTTTFAVIKSSGERYEVMLSSNLKNDAGILLTYKPR